MLGFGPWAEVVEPAALRKQMGDLLAEASSLYRPRGKR
jgi:hypothetical protein